MEWKDINVFQYQQIVKALDIKDDLDRNSRFIAILNNITDNEVDSLSVAEYNKQTARASFIYNEVKGNPVKFINVNGRRYKCIYDVRKLPSARYIESKVFQADIIGNLHKIAASMVIPMKRTLFGWREDKFKASDHDIYSQDMLEAKFVDVYHSVVFFYHVWRIWMECSKDYLIAELNKKGQKGEKVLQDLLNIMDGNILPPSSLNTIVSRLTKRTKYTH
jgi:hypothetical protein